MLTIQAAILMVHTIQTGVQALLTGVLNKQRNIKERILMPMLLPMIGYPLNKPNKKGMMLMGGKTEN